MPRVLTFATLLFALIVSAGCAVNPATGGATIVLAGEDSESGQEMYEKFKAEGAFYDDPELQAYIEKIGQRLVANSDMPDKTFTFSVIDAPDINAFATPGGFIYVNRGLLAYLDDEAELAGVIAHEIAHVTARHHARRKTAGVTSKVLATTAYVFTGSGALYEASSMYGAELLSGYGRDMELEADGLGAQYMYRSGYEPDALLEVIGVLKNQEQYQRVRAKATGKPVATYHGLYASHPRNDKRLQTVVRAANELDSGEYIENPELPGEFRQHTNGMIWGDNSAGQRAENRYYHNNLGFTFAHPEGWTVQANSQAVLASSADGSARVSITLRRRDATTSAEQVLTSAASGDITDGAPLEQAGLVGYTAVASSGGASKRLAVVDMGSLTYLFEGSGTNFAAQDPALLELVESFRPMLPQERQSGQPRYVQYIQVPRGATLETLAAGIQVPDAEAQLRLMNGFYPRGEPRTGDWIKVIR